MNRTSHTFQVNDIETFKQKMLSWATRFNIFVLLDSHSYHDAYSKEEWILAAGAAHSFQIPGNDLNQLKQFIRETNDWLFGHAGYDLKNHIETLHSAHPDHIGFPDMFFFQPEMLIRKQGQFVEVSSLTHRPDEIFNDICATQNGPVSVSSPVEIMARLTKVEYLETIHRLKQHILRGDCYEINFCQEFYSENVGVDPVDLYRRLSVISPMPFSGLYKLGDKYLVCASPERFIQKTGKRIIAQPIKGTIARDLYDKDKDQQLKQQLFESQKDKSENVMIVDLMRNDLSKVCKEASVRVEELYGIYRFPQVHQMISTIVGELKDDIDLSDVLQATFPMGSMTGAPKRMVMELTERYEKTKRGIYSGSIGYIRPGGDFDFNVVIRSIMYNQSNRYLSYQVGGGITFYSDPDSEYEECMLKAAAIKKVLNEQHL